MKTLFTYCTIIAILLHCGFTKAQCPSFKTQFEITASYGFVTADKFFEDLSASTSGQGSSYQTYNSGASFITARYFIYNRLAIGLAGGITHEKGNNTDGYGSMTLITSNYVRTITTVAFDLYYIYKFRKYMELYTFFEVGPSITNTQTDILATPVNNIAAFSSASVSGFNIQYTPIGIRVGGRLGAFAELGVGYKGIFNCGLSFRFGTPWYKL